MKMIIRNLNLPLLLVLIIINLNAAATSRELETGSSGRASSGSRGDVAKARLWDDHETMESSAQTRFRRQIMMMMDGGESQLEESMSPAPFVSPFVSNQCPTSDTIRRFLASNSSHDQVEVDPVTGRRTFKAKIVGIFPCLDSDSSGNDLTLDFRLAKPVIDLAIKAVNSKYKDMHFEVTYRKGPNICRHQQAAGKAAEEYYVNGASYFVGPGCSESLASVGQLASYWNVPMCSTGYLPEMELARFSPLTLIQLSLSVQSVGEMLLELFQMYKWRHLVILTDDKHPLHSLIRDGLLEFFRTLYMLPSTASQIKQIPITGGAGIDGGGGAAAAAAAAAASQQQDMNNPNLSRQQQQQQQQQYSGGGSAGRGGNGGQQRLHSSSSSAAGGGIRMPYYINITSRNFAYSKNEPLDYEQIISEAASYSRVMLLLARSSTIGYLLEAAHNQGMSKGQFVFIAHELFEIQSVDASGSGASGSGSGSGSSPSSAGRTGNHHFSEGSSLSVLSMQKQKYALDDKIEIQSRGNASNDQLTREIFGPLMTISLRIPTTTEFDAFRAEVAGLSEREFNYRIQPSSLKSLYSLGVAAFIYDCVMLYADKVDYVLNKTQFSKINGETIFELSAGKTFTGALTGDLTINKAGQRVIDFTLNDFSPKSLSLEPIAHFVAMERRLSFLPGKAPHWVARNQSTPRSDPRCRINDLFCRFNEDDPDSANGYHNGGGGSGGSGGLGSDRFVLGVWLVVVVVFLVTLTSSIIGWLVYRRFRIESELLNLWWSIKYEDIQFEDEAEAMCDGKRSVSSLAISNESFNERNTNEAAATTSGPHPSASKGDAGCDQGASPSKPQQQHNHHIQLAAAPATLATSAPATTTALSAAVAVAAGPLAPDCQSVGHPIQLSVCHSLGHDGVTILSTAHSTSSLSVTGANQPSLTGSSSALAGGQTYGGGGGGQCGSPATAVSSSNLTCATNTNSRISAGASKLIPLINKGTTVTRSGATGKFSGSSNQLAGSGGSKWPGQVAAGGGGGGGHPKGLGAGGGGVGQVGGNGSSANNKDPSISSQNKNVKLRLGTILRGGREQIQTTKVGMYKASRVAVKHLNVRNLSINRQLLIELRQVRDLTHENLIKFIGLCPEETNVAIVSELCTRGNLQDLLQNETIRLDWPFRYSILNDIVDGLIHLHSSPILYHGRLKSSNCVIDNRFVVKLTDFGLPTLLSAIELEESVNPRLLLWTAPEHLRTKHPLLSGSQKGDIYSLAIIFQEIITRCGPFECEPILCGASEVAPAPIDWQQQQQQQQQQQHQRQHPVTQLQQQVAPLIRATDAGGQVLIQQQPAALATVAAAPRGRQQQRGPGGMQTFASKPLLQPIVVQHKQRLEPEEIVNLVRMGLSPPFRPYFRPDVAATATGDFNVADLITMVQNCWQEAPALRPNVANVKQQIKKMRRGCHLDGANLMDNLLQRMERYTDNLESLVEQKTAELMEEKKRSEELLYEMLPRFVVDQLKYGHSVTPEAYEAVTISFSDIKDFTSIAAQSSPIEVVNLLNQLYTEFDDCIAQYDVYKVETIGDAYMVVSGLPIRNGDQHAREIAEMSLALLELIRNFDVAHLPHVNLELRIGIHSGPCASGVVGTRMFRYCLFGDTVNTASRMESHGEPMKIHTSEDSANILSRFGNFIIEPRGCIEIKGKGLMNTYWLVGKT